MSLAKVAEVLAAAVACRTAWRRRSTPVERSRLDSFNGRGLDEVRVGLDSDDDAEDVPAAVRSSGKRRRLDPSIEVTCMCVHEVNEVTGMVYEQRIDQWLTREGRIDDGDGGGFRSAPRTKERVLRASSISACCS